jgi:hypothetical protein
MSHDQLFFHIRCLQSEIIHIIIKSLHFLLEDYIYKNFRMVIRRILFFGGVGGTPKLGFLAVNKAPSVNHLVNY